MIQERVICFTVAIEFTFGFWVWFISKHMEKRGPSPGYKIVQTMSFTCCFCMWSTDFFWCRVNGDLTFVWVSEQRPYSPLRHTPQWHRVMRAHTHTHTHTHTCFSRLWPLISLYGMLPQAEHSHIHFLSDLSFFFYCCCTHIELEAGQASDHCQVSWTK